MKHSTETTRIMLGISKRQHGVVSRKQLVEAGIPPRTIDRRVSRAGLFVVYPGVYAVGRPTVSMEGIILASLLGAGDGAVLGCRSAAAVWGFLKHESPIEVLRLDGGTNQRARVKVEGKRWWPYLHVMKPRNLPEVETTIRDGLNLTSPARTLRDVAAFLSRRQFERIFTEADRLGVLEDEDLLRCAVQSQGKKGAQMLRRAVARRIPGIEDAASLLEALLLELCDLNQIPRPVTNRMIGAYRPDFQWPEHSLIVEVDGYEFHRGREMFENDLLRDDRLRAQGWTVRRFSWRMVNDEPEEVARSIRRELNK